MDINVWYNHKTGKADLIVGIPNNLKDYLPQHPSALAVYELLVKAGLKPLDAFIKASLIWLDMPPEEE